MHVVRAGALGIASTYGQVGIASTPWLPVSCGSEGWHHEICGSAEALSRSVTISSARSQLGGLEMLEPSDMRLLVAVTIDGAGHG